MIDLLYLTHNRLEFTKASLAALIAHTNWGEVERLLIYDDASSDGTREYLEGCHYPKTPELHCDTYHGPVAVMIDYISNQQPERQRLFAKIDSDTIVPPGWLDAALPVMERYPELDLLGIEAVCPLDTVATVRNYRPAEHIGGIGLMRVEAFVTLPRPSGPGGRFGFTAWQAHAKKMARGQEHPIVPGWLNPSVPVFLLDRLPREPWRSLSERYVEQGWQRPWAAYEEKDAALWSWWCP